MSETIIERVAKAIGDAIDPTSGDPIGVTFHHSEFVEGETMHEQLEQVKSICLAAARAAIEAVPIEKMIVDAYVRGVEWGLEHQLILEYRFKAARDYADKTLSQDTPSLPTPAATPTDSANPPPVESVGPNSEAQS